MQIILRKKVPQSAPVRILKRQSEHSLRFNLKKLVAVAFLLFSISLPARAQINIPQPQGMVSDFAGKLSPETKSSLETLLTNFSNRSGGVEIAVVTVPHEWLGGYSIEEYGLQFGRQWKVGRGSDKAGLVLLVAIRPPSAEGVYGGNTRMEVSRHLEGEIPDGLAGEILSRMRADFRAGRFDQAITTGVQTILATIARERGISMEGIDQRMAYRQQARPRRSRGTSPFAILVIIIVVFFILSAIGRGRGGPGGGGRRRRYGSDWMLWPIIFGGGGPGGFGGYRGGSDWGGGSGGGGFGGFGGGGDFGGGGASDSW